MYLSETLSMRLFAYTMHYLCTNEITTTLTMHNVTNLKIALFANFLSNTVLESYSTLDL